MELGGLDVAGVRRTYWLARSPDAQAPLLMLLPGSGTTGRDVATTFTGLATRGPATGVTVVFPDGWGKVWHVDGPPPGQPALDDAAFLRALACQLQGTAEPQPLFLAGISNGAGFAEHVGRHGLLPLAGLFLVVGTVRESSRQAVPVPRQQAAVTIMAGTGDKMVSYDGGDLRASGLVGLKLRRRAARHRRRAGGRRAARGAARSAGDPADLVRT
jgi:polyhydroxybutyrate depolymerase